VPVPTYKPHARGLWWARVIPQATQTACPHDSCSNERVQADGKALAASSNLEQPEKQPMDATQKAEGTGNPVQLAVK